MKLCSINTKKVLIFVEKNPCTSQPQTQSFSLKKTKPALKRFLYIYFLKKAPNFQETKAPKKNYCILGYGNPKKASYI